MRIATFNVNGINARLPVLLEWLALTVPDIVCLQELKAPEERFPDGALRDAGYGAIWHGQKSWNGVAILARGPSPSKSGARFPGPGRSPHPLYRSAGRRYARGCLYLPNGNPAPGPKFEYKLRWFERLSAHASNYSQAARLWCWLAITMSFRPISTCMHRSAGSMTPYFGRGAGRVPQSLEQGWTDALRALHPRERVYTFWKYFRNAVARDA